MKKLLTAICFIPFFAMGQLDTSFTTIPPLSAIGLTTAVWGLPHKHTLPKMDSIPVIFEYADTSINSKRENSIGFIFWTKGYSVRDRHNTSELKLINTIYYDYMKPVYYLTEDFKPIPKGWVIWDIK